MKSNNVDFFNNLTKDCIIFSKDRNEIDFDTKKIQVPKFVRVNGTKYIDPIVLNNGSFGIVLKYFHELLLISKDSLEKTHNDSICVKIGKQKNSIDCDIKILKNTKIPSGIFVPGVVRSNRIVMPILSNNIDSLFEALSKNNVACDKINSIKINILHNLCRNLVVLVKHNLYFTDLKLDNILYYITNNKIVPLLCDHGSATGKDENAIFTSFSPERIKTDGDMYANTCEGDIVWGIGCIMCELWHIHPLFEKEKWDDTCEKDLQDTIDKLVNVYPQWTDLVKGIFISLDKRVTIQHVLGELDVLDSFVPSDIPIDIGSIQLVSTDNKIDVNADVKKSVHQTNQENVENNPN